LEPSIIVFACISMLELWRWSTILDFSKSRSAVNCFLFYEGGRLFCWVPVSPPTPQYLLKAWRPSYHSFPPTQALFPTASCCRETTVSTALVLTRSMGSNKLERVTQRVRNTSGTYSILHSVYLFFLSALVSLQFELVLGAALPCSGFLVPSSVGRARGEVGAWDEGVGVPWEK